MKTILKILGIALGIILIIVLSSAAYINFSDTPTYPVEPQAIKILPDSSSMARAEKMAKTICATCHLGDDGKLSGKMVEPPESDFGEMWSANITNHPELGIGRYSDEELAFLFRTGIKKNGKLTPHFMTKTRLSDEDLVALIHFLRSDDLLVQSSEAQPPVPEYSFLAKALFKFGAIKPESLPMASIPTPSPEDQVSYGNYLATEVYECSTCHSKGFETLNLREPELSEGFMGGGTLVLLPGIGAAVSRNITMHPEWGIGKWTLEDFAKSLRERIRPDQTTLTPLMPNFSDLADEEIQAIWAYLQTVPKIKGNFVKE